MFNVLQTEDDWTLLLPDEILLKIFKYLPKSCLLNISSVCQRWNQISSERILWRGIDISGKNVPFSTLARILSKGVVALQMVGTEVHGSRTEPSEGYQLSMLDAEGASISTENLFALLSQCRNLEKLNLMLCTLNDDICRKIGAISCLTVLDISHCSGATTEFISRMNRLEELNVSFITMDDTNFSYLLSHLPTTLKRLNMYKVSQQLSDEDIDTICSSCPNLMELIICGREGHTNRTIDTIMKLLPNLQHLTIGGCLCIAFPKLTDLASMKSLKTLTLDPCLERRIIEILSMSLVGVQIIMSQYLPDVARSFLRENPLWGFPIDEF